MITDYLAVHMVLSGRLLQRQSHFSHFTEAVGPVVSIPVSILETFKLFMVALVTTVVEQTNLRALQVPS